MTAATRRVRSNLEKDIAKRTIRGLAPSEAQIQQTCTEWLALDGWRAIVTDPPHMRGLGVSEKGIPDRLYIRYCYSGENCSTSAKNGSRWDMNARLLHTQAVWIEWKKKGGKAKEHQKDWHYAERLRGALVWVAGENFPATIEGFQKFYRESGLMRRKL